MNGERIFNRGEVDSMNWWEKIVHDVLDELIDFDKLIFLYNSLGLEKILVIGEKNFIIPKPIYWKVDDNSIREFLTTLIRAYQLIDFDFHDEFEFIAVKYLPFIGYESALEEAKKYLEAAMNNNLFFSALKSSFFYYGAEINALDKYRSEFGFYSIPGILLKIGLKEYEYIVGVGVHLVIVEDEKELGAFSAIISEKKKEIEKLFSSYR